MSWFPYESASNLSTSDNGATRPTSDTDTGRFEVLHHEVPLNPVRAQVVYDLLHKTLQNLVLGENQDLSTETPAAATLPRRPLLPRNPLWGSCTNVMLTVVSSVRALVSVGARVALPKEATLDGQSPQSNPKAVHHRTCLAALTDTFVVVWDAT